ncbi:MAG: hypothetical protein IPM50_14185 [Acidobacteriota bacterium]|nr:MAG: hypothetical protein IPM50_14185 [Acidobacteriota bacterium]
MTKIIIMTVSVLLTIACSGTDPAKNLNSPAGNAAGNSNVGVLPPGMTPELIEIQEVQPPQVVTMEKGQPNEKSTPGIPGPEELKKPFKPGSKPTPGIPDEKTVKKMLSDTASNSNVVKQ